MAGGGGGEEQQAASPSSPTEDLVLEPPALALPAVAVAGPGPGPGPGGAAVGGSGVAEQYLDHVLEALVRARGIVLPRVRCVGVGCVPRTALWFV